MHPTTLTRTLRIDAAANALAGAVLVAAGGWLATPLGLAAGWPLRFVGAALAAYGAENLLVARRPTAVTLTGLVVVDLLFGAAVLVVAIANPTAAEGWARWTLAAAADLSLAFGVMKLFGLRSLHGRTGETKGATSVQ
jgi:Na+/H+ antiporter NhaA